MSKGYCNIRGRGLKFCQGSVADLQQKLVNLSEDKMISWSGYYLIHYGLEGNCLVKGQEIDFTFEDTVEWADTLTIEEVAEVQAAYNSTLEYQKVLPVENSTKKKPIKKHTVKGV